MDVNDKYSLDSTYDKQSPEKTIDIDSKLESTNSSHESNESTPTQLPTSEGTDNVTSPCGCGSVKMSDVPPKSKASNLDEVIPKYLKRCFLNMIHLFMEN